MDCPNCNIPLAHFSASVRVLETKAAVNRHAIDLGVLHIDACTKCHYTNQANWYTIKSTAKEAH